MANYFSKYQGRGGPAIAPGIVQMMGSIGDEYAKGISKLGEGIAEGYGEYRKNKAEKGKAEADFENALSRMGSLYGEEPGDYQQVLNAVDAKTMEKIKKGKGTKEDFLSALNSLNTVGESIEDRREDAESARRFDVTTAQRERQIEATTALGWGGIASRKEIADKGEKGATERIEMGITARAAEGDASRTHSAAEGKADRGSREGMHTAGIASAEAMQTERLAQSEDQFKDKLDQDFFLEMGRQGLSREEIDQRYTIHRESSDQAWNLAQDKMAQQQRHFNDTLKETKRVNQVTIDKFRQEGDRAKAGQAALGTYTDKTQTEFDPDAHSAAMMGVGSLSGPTPAQLQSYMDNPEQFQRQLTNSERAVKALRTPGISPEVQDRIATMANTDAGTGGVKFVRHPETGEYVMAVGPKGSMSQLPSSRKTVGEMRIEFDILRDKARGIKDDQKRLDYLNDQKTKQLGELRSRSITPEEEDYKAVVSMWDGLLRKQRVRMGIEEEFVREYDSDGKRKK